MSSETKLTRDEDGEPIDDTKYRGMIGSLLYLTASRPNIMFSVSLCARFQEAPKSSHLEAVKRIFRYIKGCRVDPNTIGFPWPLETIVYADSDRSKKHKWHMHLRRLLSHIMVLKETNRLSYLNHRSRICLPWKSLPTSLMDETSSSKL
ncbi:hypothetical protein Tco_1259530 [Tanacetum coccineum]